MHNVLFEISIFGQYWRMVWDIDRDYFFAPVPCPVVLFGRDGFAVGLIFLLWSFSLSIEKR
jgi:hypothetical protein